VLATSALQALQALPPTLMGANDMEPLLLAVDLLVELLKNAGQISQLIQTAQANGQTTLTPEQWPLSWAR